MEPSKADFCHPYQPYDIQLEFMSNLYRCIDKRQIGIFESPTGTGKSLSLICGALTWLRDHKRRSLDAAVDVTSADDDTPEWMRLAEQNERHKHLLRQREELEAKLAIVRKEEARRAQATSTNKPDRKRQRLSKTEQSVQNGEDEEQFMLAEYESELHTLGAGPGYSVNTQALLDQLKGAPLDLDEETEQDETKIIFCSRTHSQLTQFVNELRRVKPPRSLPIDDGASEDSELPDEIVKHVPLGSRKNLCIHPKVSKLSSAAAINDRCLELQRPGTAKEHKCTFVPSKDSKSIIENFRNRALAHVQDIEDLGRLGKTMAICPYYASRSAIAPSEIVTLPYPLLLQKSARDALGISLKDNVIVIDEAHNLMDAIAGLYSVSLTLKQLETATTQVYAYVERFAKRLKGWNRVYVTQLVRALDSIRAFLVQVVGDQMECEHTVTAAQLMDVRVRGCDQVKPHKLVQYLQESKLAHKVEGYIDAKADAGLSKDKGILLQFQSLLMVLMNPADEGKFFVVAKHGEISLRYILLDPRAHFRDIVEESRAVILAGGTMSPMSDYADYLFSYISPERLVNFSFGHVIPSSNLFAQAVVRGPSARNFLFDYSNRTSDALIMELRLLLQRVCSVVPDGVVVFFPSYDYLTCVVKTWIRLSDGVETLRKYKQVFTESRFAGVDDMKLRAYTQAIDEGSGALMLAVVGGKLSEGINFSDKLGRAVVTVGLPFPDATSAEWKAKMAHVEFAKYTIALSQGSSQRDARAIGVAARSDFYENACMRAVNQCIGRAIRHKNDYAAILLVDGRFEAERIQKKLPTWIRDNIKESQEQKPWDDIEAKLKEFFADKTSAE